MATWINAMVKQAVAGQVTLKIVVTRWTNEGISIAVRRDWWDNLIDAGRESRDK